MASRSDSRERDADRFEKWFAMHADILQAHSERETRIPLEKPIQILAETFLSVRTQSSVLFAPTDRPILVADSGDYLFQELMRALCEDAVTRRHDAYQARFKKETALTDDSHYRADDIAKIIGRALSAIESSKPVFNEETEFRRSCFVRGALERERGRDLREILSKPLAENLKPAQAALIAASLGLEGLHISKAVIKIMVTYLSQIIHTYPHLPYDRVEGECTRIIEAFKIKNPIIAALHIAEGDSGPPFEDGGEEDLFMIPPDHRKLSEATA